MNGAIYFHTRLRLNENVISDFPYIAMMFFVFFCTPGHLLKSLNVPICRTKVHFRHVLLSLVSTFSATLQHASSHNLSTLSRSTYPPCLVLITINHILKIPSALISPAFSQLSFLQSSYLYSGHLHPISIDLTCIHLTCTQHISFVLMLN